MSAHLACPVGTSDHDAHAFGYDGQTVTCGGWNMAKVYSESVKARKIAEDVVKKATEEIAFKLSMVSTDALVQIIENTMNDMIWSACDEILKRRKVEGYC